MTKVLFKRKTSDEIANLPVEDGALIYNHETGATYLDYGNERIATGGGMPTGDTFPIGAITSYAGSTAPVNWLICDGRAVSRITYADLFDAIGTTYGVGDGSTTFNLPNLKGRVITGLDSSQTEFDTLGETGGEKTHILTVDEMPTHNHLFKFTKEIDSPATVVGSGEMFFGTGRNYNAGDNSNVTELTGNNQPHNILQPFITLNYIIKAFQSSGTIANVSTITTTSDTDTYSCNYINNSETYSTTEVKTNKTWIDGKPIYRKVINKTTSMSADNWTNFYYSTDLNISNIDYVRVVDAILTKTGGIKESVWSSPARIQYLNNYVSIYVDGAVSAEQFIVEYTKTTD